MSEGSDRRRWHAYYDEQRVRHQWFQAQLLKDLDVHRVLGIGPHFGLTGAMLANAGYQVSALETACSAPEAGATAQGPPDVTELRPEALAGHDAIFCCETLQHIPWSGVGRVLTCFAASKVPWLIVTVPYAAFQMGFSFYLNRFVCRRGGFFEMFRFLSTFRRPLDDDGWAPHKWEVGYKDYSLPRFKSLVTDAGYEVFRQDFTAGCRSVFLLCRNRQAGA